MSSFSSVLIAGIDSRQILPNRLIRDKDNNDQYIFGADQTLTTLTNSLSLTQLHPLRLGLPVFMPLSAGP
jgi:hypothetical protein